MAVFLIATYANQRRLDANTKKIAAVEQSDARALRTAIAAHETAVSTAVNLASGLAYDLALIRQTDYRICARQVTNQAIINILSRNHPRIPLLDCRPDLTGGKAKPLSPRQSAAFQRRIAALRSVP